MHNPELRLKSRDRQDRGVNHKNYARTTDKGNQIGWIYSLLSCYNEMKHELTLRNLICSAPGWNMVIQLSS